MLILAGTLRISPGQRIAAEAAMRRMLEATRREPGCLAYSLCFDLMDDHVLQIFEVFKDDAALAAHRASEHMAVWRTAGASFGISARDMSQYDVSASRKI
jgi:quinol monooxygenase YgiN